MFWEKVRESRIKNFSAAKICFVPNSCAQFFSGLGFWTRKSTISLICLTIPLNGHSFLRDREMGLGQASSDCLRQRNVRFSSLRLPWYNFSCKMRQDTHTNLLAGKGSHWTICCYFMPVLKRYLMPATRDTKIMFCTVQKIVCHWDGTPIFETEQRPSFQLRMASTSFSQSCEEKWLNQTSFFTVRPTGSLQWKWFRVQRRSRVSG